MSAGTRVRTVRMPDDLWIHLEDSAAGTGLSSSEYLRRLVARDAGQPNRTFLPIAGVPKMRVRDVIRATDRYLQRSQRGRRR